MDEARGAAKLVMGEWFKGALTVGGIFTALTIGFAYNYYNDHAECLFHNEYGICTQTAVYLGPVPLGSPEAFSAVLGLGIALLYAGGILLFGYLSSR